MPFFHPAFQKLSQEDPRFLRAYRGVWWGEFIVTCIVLAFTVVLLILIRSQ
jgi:hypothetical protein